MFDNKNAIGRFIHIEQIKKKEQIDQEKNRFFYTQLKIVLIR